MIFFTKFYKKKDISTNLINVRSIKKVDEIEKLEIIKKKTQTQIVYLP